MYTFDTLDFEFDMLCRSLNPAETAWYLMIGCKVIEWQKDHWALKQRGMNVMIKRLYLGGPSSGGMTIWHLLDVTMHSSNAFFKTYSTYLNQTTRAPAAAAAASHMQLRWF